MPKKITNPLRAGLPAKIYLLAFNGAKSGYDMAKRIYGVEKYPPTSKISTWIKKLRKEGIISKTGYISKIEPLQAEIEIVLKNEHDIELSDFDKHALRKVIDSPEFRSYVVEANSNIPLDQDFDSAWVIMETLGMIAWNILISIKMAGGEKPEAANEKEFDALWDQLKAKSEKPRLRSKILQIAEMTEESLVKFRDLMPNEAISVESRIEGFRRDPTKFAPFLAIPQQTLEKIRKLSPRGELFASLMFVTKNLFNLWYKKKQGESQNES